MAVQAIPEGYHTVTPYLIVKGGAAAIDYYTRVFGAQERMRMDLGDGLLGHAEIQIGDSVIMLADENPQWGALGPQSTGGTPVSILLYMEDVDRVFQRAIDAGGKVIKPVQDQFYGDRSGHFEDPFGHRWTVATHVEDVEPEEMERRMSQMAKGAGG